MYHKHLQTPKMEKWDVIISKNEHLKQYLSKKPLALCKSHPLHRPSIFGNVSARSLEIFVNHKGESEIESDDSAQNPR